ncbi:DsbA family oxidoreductase [Promicromonospora vindobonensis]|uniref:DsbA family oxidoreductase n=1 Tax=Promicromonospora vindobonensis TaxID=195748 RepID=A0ABW5VQC3_9MICO
MAGEAFGQATDRLVVDVWSDVMCPFCYMGDTLLAQALEKFPHASGVDVRYHSFLLMPELSDDDTPVSPTELLSAKHGLPRDQAQAMNDQVAERARQIGLDYHLDDAQAVGTRTAHQLSHFAATQGKQHEMVQRLFQAYFTEGLNVADRQVLGDLAADVGLDRDAAGAALTSGEFADAVEADIQQARQYGIQGVPFFVFAGKYAVSGAQPVEAFLQALDTSWAETVGSPAVGTTPAGAGR